MNKSGDPLGQVFRYGKMLEIDWSAQNVDRLAVTALREAAMLVENLMVVAL